MKGVRPEEWAQTERVAEYIQMHTRWTRRTDNTKKQRHKGTNEKMEGTGRRMSGERDRRKRKKGYIVQWREKNIAIMEDNGWK